MTGMIKAICLSVEKGTAKEKVPQAELRRDLGIVSDAHSGPGHRQVSLLAYEKVAKFGTFRPGAFGENLVIEGIDLRALPLGSRLACGEVLLEITQLGKECHHPCAIYHQMGDCIMPREGVFAKVLEGGLLSVGDGVKVLSRGGRLSAAILTLSDKGALGERADESGARIRRMLEEVGYQIAEQLLLPDDRAKIEKALVRFADHLDVALVITTGGTGFSPKDVTPEATLAVADRSVPGISEAIRAYSMQITKRAMLSRGVSVIRKETLIVNLPGSPKAVEESLAYILPELAHGIQVLRGPTEDCAEI